MDPIDKVKTFARELVVIDYYNPLVAVDAKRTISQLPDYFFEVPASSTGNYHPDWAGGHGGLVRHTKAAFKIAEMLFPNRSIAPFEPLTIALIGYAILVHDGFKLGIDNHPEKFTRFDHPMLMSEYLEKNSALPEVMISELEALVACHMGEWNTSDKPEYNGLALPTPKSEAEKFVHLCDYLASRKGIKFDFSQTGDIM